jgi:hypothetical protein
MEPVLSRIDSHYGPAHDGLGDVYAQKGMKQEAIGEWAQSAAEYGFGELAGRFREAYAKLGYERALRWELGQMARRENAGGYEPAFHIAVVWARLGKTDETLQWLKKAYADRDGDLVLIGVDPALDHIREDPRFRRLVADIGLAHAQAASLE